MIAARERASAIVRRAIDDALADGEIGIQVAVYYQGELAVDLWAGVADETTHSVVTAETLFNAFHMTKAAALIALHVQAERGLIAYDAPVCRYWPEFAAHGKDRGTVTDLLIQRLGVPYMPEGVTPERMCDWSWMAEQLAAMVPTFEPGTTSAYHTYTLGWLVGELVRRTDPRGRTFAQFVRDEICVPLDIHDLWLGIPDEAEHRVATITNFPPGTLPQDHPIFRSSPAQVFVCREVFGRSDVRRACIPGVGGLWNARSTARLFALLAGRGAIKATRLFSAARVDSFALPRPRADEVDRVLNRPLAQGIGGFHLGGDVPPGDPIAAHPHVLCHSGAGGTIGWADPVAGFAAAICHNRMFNNPTRDGNPFVRVGHAVREAVRVLGEQV
jgi:CubicO group peptidase (beta-lactamase class C family)